MLRSLLIGLVAGQRAMTPLPLLAGAARHGALSGDAPLRGPLTHPVVATGAAALAAAEMAGDKWRGAPDRTVASGLLARGVTAAYAGAALAPAGRRRLGAALATAAALASSHAGLALRKRAMRRWGQARTGFVEDLLVLGAGGLVAFAMRPANRRVVPA